MVSNLSIWKGSFKHPELLPARSSMFDVLFHSSYFAPFGAISSEFYLWTLNKAVFQHLFENSNDLHYFKKKTIWKGVWTLLYTYCVPNNNV